MAKMLKLGLVLDIGGAYQIGKDTDHMYTLESATTEHVRLQDENGQAYSMPLAEFAAAAVLLVSSHEVPEGLEGEAEPDPDPTPAVKPAAKRGRPRKSDEDC